MTFLGGWRSAAWVGAIAWLSGCGSSVTVFGEGEGGAGDGGEAPGTCHWEARPLTHVGTHAGPKVALVGSPDGTVTLVHVEYGAIMLSRWGWHEAVPSEGAFWVGVWLELVARGDAERVAVIALDDEGGFVLHEEGKAPAALALAQGTRVRWLGAPDAAGKRAVVFTRDEPPTQVIWGNGTSWSAPIDLACGGEVAEDRGLFAVYGQSWADGCEGPNALRLMSGEAVPLAEIPLREELHSPEYFTDLRLLSGDRGRWLLWTDGQDSYGYGGLTDVRSWLRPLDDDGMPRGEAVGLPLTIWYGEAVSLGDRMALVGSRASQAWSVVIVDEAGVMQDELVLPGEPPTDLSTTLAAHDDVILVAWPDDQGVAVQGFDCVP